MEQQQRTATLIRDNLPGFRGHAALYRCSPPIEGYERGKQKERHVFVVASASNAFGGGPETYLFPSNEAGEIVDWGELPPSQRGTLSHDKVFTEAGYFVTRSSEAA